MRQLIRWKDWSEPAGLLGAASSLLGALLLALGPEHAFEAYLSFQIGIALYLPALWVSGARLSLALQGLYFAINLLAGWRYFAGAQLALYLQMSAIVPLMLIALAFVPTRRHAHAGPATRSHDERLYVALSVIAALLVATNSPFTPIGFVIWACAGPFGLAFGLAQRSAALFTYPAVFAVPNLIAVHNYVPDGYRAMAWLLIATVALWRLARPVVRRTPAPANS